MTDQDKPRSAPAEIDDNAADTAEESEPRPATRLLEFLVCPITKTTLTLSRDGTELISRAARLAFPIRDGVPLLTRDTARDLTDDDR